MGHWPAYNYSNRHFRNICYFGIRKKIVFQCRSEAVLFDLSLVFMYLSMVQS